MLRSGRTSLALALAAGALGLSACGDDEGGTIPPEDADALIQEVNTLEANVEDGECSLAAASADRLRLGVDELGKEVGEPTKDDLRDLTDSLQTLISEQCDEAEEPIETTPPPSGTTGAGGSVPSDDDDSGGSEG